MLPLALAALLCAPAAAQGGAGVLNLSLVEALAAIERPELGGVFSFIAEKDAPTAFADLLVRDKKSMKKFLDKTQKDLKQAGGVAQFDGQVAETAMAILNSPIGETLQRPDDKTIRRLRDLSAAPRLSLAEMTARRRS